MTSWRRYSLWLLIGVLTAFLAHLAQGSLSDPLIVLRVGAESPARSFIEHDLGEIQLTVGTGHDAQFSYVLARLPFDLTDAARYVDNPSYRLRRPLLPWLAGGFGAFSPRTTLWAMISISAVAFGAAAVAGARLAGNVGARWWTPLGVVANLGLILSLQLATVDVLAFAFSLWAITLWIDGRRWGAAAMLAAAGLTKEVYLITAVGLLLSGTRLDLRSRLAPLLAAALPAVAWTVLVSTVLETGLSTNGNIGVPFVGIIEGASYWDSSSEVAFAALTGLVLVAGALVALLDSSNLARWHILPWLAVAILSSSVVWRGSNNALRAFAPIFYFAVLGLGQLIEARTRATQA